jgi:hypothetical protein
MGCRSMGRGERAGELRGIGEGNFISGSLYDCCSIAVVLGWCIKGRSVVV